MSVATQALRMHARMVLLQSGFSESEADQVLVPAQRTKDAPGTLAEFPAPRGGIVTDRTTHHSLMSEPYAGAAPRAGRRNRAGGHSTSALTPHRGSRPKPIVRTSPGLTAEIAQWVRKGWSVERVVQTLLEQYNRRLTKRKARIFMQRAREELGVTD